MKKLIYLLTLITVFTQGAWATTYTGGVSKVGQQESNQVIDSKSGQGVEFAKITIPQKKFRTYTDANGNFELPRIKSTNRQFLVLKKKAIDRFHLQLIVPAV